MMERAHPNERIRLVATPADHPDRTASFWVRWFVATSRPFTRLWFDAIVPVTMLAAMGGRTLSWKVSVLVVASTALWHAGQTFFNDALDVAIDRASGEPSRNRRASVTGQASQALYHALGWALTAASVVVALFLNWICSAVLVALLIPGGVAYNFKGFSGRPHLLPFGWPLIWTAIYALSAAALRFVDWADGLAYLSFVIVFMGIGEGLTQDIRDADNDKTGGRITTVVYYGVARTSVVAWAAFLFALAPWIWFAMSSRLSWPFTLAGAMVLLGWDAIALRAVARVRRAYNKADGKLLHVGAIYVFTLVNLTALAGLILREASP